MTRRSNGQLRCTVCRMHLSLCLCAELPRLRTRTRLVLLMHRKEVGKTTNTGRLAVHCVEGSTLLVHGDRAHALSCPPLLGRRPLVLLPDDAATELTVEHARGAPVILFVPDGTWRQASKMRRRLPWLASMPCVSLPPGPPTAYDLRSANKPGGLGTLEAIARALGVLEGPEVQAALERVFRLMVERTLYSRGAIPKEDVFGGLAEGVFRHDPRAPGRGSAAGARLSRLALTPYDMGLVDELLGYVSGTAPDESAHGFVDRALGTASPFVLAAFGEGEKQLDSEEEKEAKANAAAAAAGARIAALFPTFGSTPYPKGVYSTAPTVGLLTIAAYAPRDANDNLAVDPTRLRIALIALGEVGKVEAHTREGAGNRCKGADRLKYYYDRTGTTWSEGVGDWRLNIDSTQSSGPYKGHKRVSWCQIFSGWARREGNASGAWVTRGEEYVPEIGDSVYIDGKNQHEGIVISIHGNKVTTVDANIGPVSGIVVSERTFGKGSGITFRQTTI